MTVYTILIKHDNDDKLLFSEKMVEIIKRNNGAVVLSGFNPVKYIACLAFVNYYNRDRCAAEFADLGVQYKTRYDGIVDDNCFGIFGG